MQGDQFIFTPLCIAPKNDETSTALGQERSVSMTAQHQGYPYRWRRGKEWPGVPSGLTGLTILVAGPSFSLDSPCGRCSEADVLRNPGRRILLTVLGNNGVFCQLRQSSPRRGDSILTGTAKNVFSDVVLHAKLCRLHNVAKLVANEPLPEMGLTSRGMKRDKIVC